MSHSLNKALLLSSLAVLLAVPATALAGTCGVLPFSASSDVNRGAAPNITALVSSELDIRGGYDLVIAASPEEFEGGDCGGSPACIKQFGQANKHEAVVAGNVATAGEDTYRLTLKLHDGRSAGLIRAVSRDVPSSADALMGAVTAVVVELVTGEAPSEDDDGDGPAEDDGPLFDDLDFDEMMDEAEVEVKPNNRKRGRAAPRNPGDDRDRSYDEDEDDDPFGVDELDALDLSAEEMEKKKRDRERAIEEERQREIAEKRAARERAEQEREKRIAEERAREEEERMRAERAERDRRARADRERRETEERERIERERREREDEERRALADRERRQREEAEQAERDRARREKDKEERLARAEREAREEEAAARDARARREQREQEESRSRASAERQKEEEYTRDRSRSASRDDDMSARVERERARRRGEEIDRAEREQDDDEAQFESGIALAPATGIMIGSAFDDDEDGGGFFIGPGDDDDDDDGILIGSAADEIDFSDDDDEEPREGMIISDAADDDENPGVRRRREAEQGGSDRYARARDFGGSDRSPAADDDEDDEDVYRRADEDDEDDYRRADEDDRGSTTSSSSRTASRDRDRGFDRDERVASRDTSYLADDDYDEYDLDADTSSSYAAPRRSASRSKVSRSSTSSGNRPWFSARLSGGYTNYYLHFAQYGFDLAVFPAPRVSVDLQVDFWTLSIRECPECEQEFRTLPSFYLGGSYRFTNLKIVQPYVGGDVGAVVYAIGTLDDGTGVIERRPLMGAAFEAKGGVDFMFTRHFGVGVGLKAGLAYAPKIKDNVHPDWNPLQFLLNARIAAVVQF